MPRIGAVDNTNIDGFLGNTHRMFVTGIDAAANTGGTLDSIELFIYRGSGPGNADDMKLGLYYGGVSDSDMDGAIKIIDLDFPNMSANNGLTDTGQWITLAFPGGDIPASERLWVAYIGNYYINCNSVNPAGPDVGDLLPSTRAFPQYRYDGLGGLESELPATLNPASDADVASYYPLKVAVNYTEGASGIDGSGAAQAQASAVIGASQVVKTAAGVLVSASAVSAGVGTVTVPPRTVSFLQADGTELRNNDQSFVTGVVRWEWYDNPDSTAGDPQDSGTSSISAGGEWVETVASSNAIGEDGQMIVYVGADPYQRMNFRVPVG